MTKILEQALRIAKQHIIISSFIMHVTKENLQGIAEETGSRRNDTGAIANPFY